MTVSVDFSSGISQCFGYDDLHIKYIVGAHLDADPGGPQEFSLITETGFSRPFLYRNQTREGPRLERNSKQNIMKWY